jgi:hypothetical protein
VAPLRCSPGGSFELWLRPVPDSVLYHDDAAARPGRTAICAYMRRLLHRNVLTGREENIAHDSCAEADHLYRISHAGTPILSCSKSAIRRRVKPDTEITFRDPTQIRS